MELPAPGQIFQGKYKLQEVLGRGGFAAVFRATDVEIGRDVAIKVLAPGVEGYSAGIVSRFMREARVIGGFQDPHTITMFEFGRSDDGLLFMVFEYVRGDDLARVIRQRGPMPQQDVVHILQQVLQALREAHSAGVLHRDIKPANILIYDYMDDPNRVKLLDFGIAKHVAGAASGGNLTREGAMVGTPRYMSPEQIYGGDLSPASDIYSLGLVSHEMLRGSPAITGANSKEMLRMQLADEPVLIPRNVHSQEALYDIVDRMTSRNAEERYPSAAAVIHALELVAHDNAERVSVPILQTPAPFQQVEFTPTDTARPLLEPGPGATTSPTTESDEPSAVVLVVAALTAAVVVVGLLALYSMATREEAPQGPAPLIAHNTPAVSPPALVDDNPPEREREPTILPAKLSTPDVGLDVGSNTQIGGCGKEGRAGENMLYVEHGIDKRSFYTYVPKSYDSAEKHPVVLMFHKSTKDGRSMVNDTKFRAIADEKGFVIIAPDARNSTDPWADEDGPFVQEALAVASGALCLDHSRIYAVGHGSGSKMAMDLSCYMPLSATATSGYSDHIGTLICAAKPPTPTIRFHGKKDNYNPFKGGPGCLGGKYRSVKQMEKDWRQRNQCKDSRSRYARRNGGTCYTWSCDAKLVSCHTDGGHDWPTANPELIELPGCVSPPADFPYGDVIWEFFEKHGRRLEVDE